MEPINPFGSSFNNIHQHHHLPIRRFSQAARVEEQHELLQNDHSSWDLFQHLNDQIYPTEEYQFVDSFINIEHVYNNHTINESLSSPEENENHMLPFDSFFNDVDVDVDLGLDTFLINDDNVEVDMMIDQTEYGSIDMSSSCEDSTLLEMSTQPTSDTIINGVDDGLQLVHLLLACAEAVGCRDTQLSDSILSQIWYSANPIGDSLQRVSYCFAVGLRSRLLNLQNVNPNGTINRFAGVIPPSPASEVMSVSREERIEAFHLLHQNTPYIKFAISAANEAIVQAIKGKERIHVIDLGIEHTLQWFSLIRTLSLITDPEVSVSVSLKLLRITGILGDRGETAEIESSMAETVVAEAKLIGIEVKFRLITGPATPAMLTRENLRLNDGESLIVNSVLHLHTYVKESRGSLKTILQSIKKLSPTILTVVEQDANHNGPFFLGRFLESLHYYSAIFDSLEASMGRNSIERMKIERNHFAEEIKNIVAYEGVERVERHERADQWRRQLGRAGFQVVTGVKTATTAAMESVSSGGDGYTVGSDQKGYVLLGWKGRPIMLAAAWQPSSPPSSA